MNRTPPEALITDPGADISPAALEVIGTLARTYEAQRRRLMQRRLSSGPNRGILPAATFRPLWKDEPGVTLDGAPVSAAIVDAVTMAPELAGSVVKLPLPFPEGPDNVDVADAGWWDALLGDVERRTGLSPRSIRVKLHPDTSAQVRAVFADRVAD